MEYTEMELRCKHCSHIERCGSRQMLARLQAAGALRRTREPESELVLELFAATVDRFTCEQCGEKDLTCHEITDNDWGVWEVIRNCESCRQPISPERLEVFPQTQLCLACQGKEEVGSLAEVEYCPRCGDVMKTRLVSRGTSRYVMSCAGCGART